jgi:hypothetical protein
MHAHTRVQAMHELPLHHDTSTPPQHTSESLPLPVAAAQTHRNHAATPPRRTTQHRQQRTLMVVGIALMKATSLLLALTRTPTCQSGRYPGGCSAHARNAGL